MTYKCPVGPSRGCSWANFGVWLVYIWRIFMVLFVRQKYHHQMWWYSRNIWIGIGSGLVYAVGIVVLGLYFEKYRPLAFGIGLAGGGVANIAFPWITSSLIDVYGWRGNLKTTLNLKQKNAQKNSKLWVLEKWLLTILSFFVHLLLVWILYRKV